MAMNRIQPSRHRWQFSMQISHLVALSNNSVIGVNNNLPWKLKRDLQHFSAYTQKKAMVMGRKTFESIGRPLPNRHNIVISSSLECLDGLEIVRSLEEGIQAAHTWNVAHQIEDEVVLSGVTFKVTDRTRSGRRVHWRAVEVERAVSAKKALYQCRGIRLACPRRS